MSCTSRWILQKVCEKSLTSATGGPNGPLSSSFVRAKMLSSGFLIRPCDGGGSIIHTVDHVDLDVSSVPEVLRPLYEFSKILAQKMTVAALRHVRQIAQEASGEVQYSGGRQPAILRTFSQRLCRGFNDAVDGFVDDGWSPMSSDGDITIMINTSSAKFAGSQDGCSTSGTDAYSAASLRATPFVVPCVRTGGFPTNQVILPLAQTLEHEEDIVSQLQAGVKDARLLLEFYYSVRGLVLVKVIRVNFRWMS